MQYKNNIQIKTLYKNEWLEMREIKTSLYTSSFIFSHAPKGDGHAIAVLPYMINKKRHFFKKTKELSYLLRYEIVPCWDATERSLTCITGMHDHPGDNVRDAAYRELEEESGIPPKNVKMLVDLGICRTSKTSDTIMHLFAAECYSFVGKAKGDGSELEKFGYCTAFKSIKNSADPIIYILQNRLKTFLNME